MAGPQQTFSRRWPITFGFMMARPARPPSCVIAIVSRRSGLALRLFEFGGACGTLALAGRKRVLAVQEALRRAKLGLAQPRYCLATRERDRIAEAGCFLGLLTGTLAKFATGPEVDDAKRRSAKPAKPFAAKPRLLVDYAAKKRNPISCVYITACAASVRQSVAALLTAHG